MDTTRLFRLDGRVAPVTGGSRGIGRMIAAGFLAQGATVYISSRKADACVEAAKELGGKYIALPQHVSTVAGCKAFGRETWWESVWQYVWCQVVAASLQKNKQVR